MCIRYLKGEHADVQLMYLCSVSVLGSAVLCVIAQHRHCLPQFWNIYLQVIMCCNFVQHSQWLFLAIGCICVSYGELCRMCSIWISNEPNDCLEDGGGIPCHCLEQSVCVMGNAVRLPCISRGMLPAAQVLQMHYGCILPFVDMTFGYHAGFEQSVTWRCVSGVQLYLLSWPWQSICLQ